MAHKLIGTPVELNRPVVVKAGFTRQNEDTGEPPEHVEAVVKMVPTIGIVVGVEPQYNADNLPSHPLLHIAFLHPDRLHHIGGSGWREAFDRLISVKPAGHPDVEANDNVAYYRSEATEEAAYHNRRPPKDAANQAEESPDATSSVTKGQLIGDPVVPQPPSSGDAGGSQIPGAGAADNDDSATLGAAGEGEDAGLEAEKQKAPPRPSGPRPGKKKEE